MRVTSRTGKRAEVCVRIWRKTELGTRRQTRRIDFWSSQTRGERALYEGRSRRGPNEWDSIEDCVSPPYVETFNSKLIKRFRTWTRSRYVFSNSEIPMSHYMSISHMAIFVYMAMQHVYIYIYKFSRTKSNILTTFNERTNTLLYKNIPLTFYSQKGWCWLWVRGELETGTGCYILTPGSSDHSSTSFASCGTGC